MKKKIIVIGNGMVGYKFLEKLALKGGHKLFNITVFGDERYLGYDRVQLSSYFAGQTVEDLTLAPFSWYEDHHFKLYLNEKVISLDRESKTLTTCKDKTLPYDILILATGSAAFVPPLKGVNRPGVFVYRTIEDLDKIIAYGQTCQTAAVMGGGLLGLEAAKAMVDLKLKTHVIEFASRLMPRQLDDAGSQCLQRKIEELGVGIHLNMHTQEILGEEVVTGLSFDGAAILNVDMLVISAGIRPRDELAKQSGLGMGERGGIIVDSQMKTSDPDIYAIGECALYKGRIYGLVAPGYQMAGVAVDSILNEMSSFEGSDMSTKLKLMGVAVGSFGDPFVEGEHIRNLIVQNEAKGIYKKLVIDSQENILLGGILVGDCSEYGQLLQRTQMQSILPTELEELIVKVSGSNDMEHPIDAMPGEALVCSCESVSKQTLLDAFDQGSHCVDSLKKYTKAGTGCGGCVPMLTDIVNRQKEKVGEVVRKVLCEHFDYTRQELVEKIRSNPLHQFSDLLKELGTGQGCEICKPAIASILASYRNEHVMKHQNIQETNDFYMANIQKDGTYSIVPRIAAGEVTAAQLIAIGEVARDFNLYSKITGGQRIDLFGARIENLPKIWKKLIDVGLESGHAYAKSLRTVKSCVGSTWCRFGVQDSTSLAITIENRYKGLRSPHKLKSAVSGCIRECAEARGKDFGIIATEKGYNLYVCGNGGMKPRVADLFAENLTEEDLIQYLDRFLMYYVRTADRLMRTSTWLDSMEGGLERLKQVIIEDSLGICEELESEMQHVVDTYQCEWKTTINDPKSLKKFRSFINLDETDTSIGCEEEQGQKKQLAF